jgi:actin-related protein
LRDNLLLCHFLNLASIMSGGVYGGDEVSALVFDPGHYSLRIGYAGEDLPKSEVPAVVGVSDDIGRKEQDAAMDVDNGAASSVTSSEKKYHIDTVALNYAKAGMETASYMKDGMIHDWDVFEEVLDYSFAKVLKSDSECHPVLFTEASWNQKVKREKLTEVMFEKYNVPAFFICKNAVLTAFANGRSTGLVLDSGATHTSAVPVHDGYVLQQAIVKSPLGGDFITMQCRQLLEEQMRNVGGIVPPYQISAKEEVASAEQAKWTKKPNLPEVTRSWHNHMVRNTVLDFQSSVLQVSDMPYDEEMLSNVPTVYHEFPNGYNNEYGVDRYRIAETLFNPAHFKGPPSQGMLNVSHAVTTAVGELPVKIFVRIKLDHVLCHCRHVRH